jgi:uncharacterized membrane protein YoaK (UPF0700 family)
VVVSHVTGNVTHFGKAAGEVISHLADQGAPDGAWREIVYFGYVVLMFFLGAVTSAVMTEGARRIGARSKYILPVSLEAILLIAFAIGIDLHYQGAISAGDDRHFLWMSGAGALSMGLQNATITRISGAVVRTTHLTGVVTDLGLEGVQYLWWAWDKLRARRQDRLGRVFRITRRHPSALRLALLGSIFGSFLFGVTAGAAVFAKWPTVALILPIAFLAWIILMDWRKPIADVRELDLTRDPDFAGYESVREFLPPELGIYRLVHHKKTGMHHPPDFTNWVERLPRHWRVIILAISPLTSFDVDGMIDLTAALKKLRSDRRDLIMFGVRPNQYRIMMQAGFIDTLGIENVCPDLDMAIARGMNRISDLSAPGNGNGAVEAA